MCRALGSSNHLHLSRWEESQNRGWYPDGHGSMSDRVWDLSCCYSEMQICFIFDPQAPQRNKRLKHDTVWYNDTLQNSLTINFSYIKTPVFVDLTHLSNLSCKALYIKDAGGLGVRDWGHALINAYHKIVNSQHGVHGEILSFFLHSISECWLFKEILAVFWGGKYGSKPWVLEDVSPPNQEPIRTFFDFRKSPISMKACDF